jgi:hypothetical protein
VLVAVDGWLRVQHFANLPRVSTYREARFDERRAELKDPMLFERIIRIAGHG